MKSINQKIVFFLLVAIVALLISACSTDNKSGQGQEDATKPPPQVHVGALPTLTPAPEQPTEPGATLTVAPTAAQVFAWPTEDEDAIANDIESMMDDMDNTLKNQNFNLKP